MALPPVEHNAPYRGLTARCTSVATENRTTVRFVVLNGIQHTKSIFLVLTLIPWPLFRAFFEGKLH
jgi:hypothetical protein